MYSIAAKRASDPMRCAMLCTHQTHITYTNDGDDEADDGRTRTNGANQTNERTKRNPPHDVYKAIIINCTEKIHHHWCDNPSNNYFHYL